MGDADCYTAQWAGKTGPGSGNHDRAIFDLRQRLSFSAAIESPFKTPLLANYTLAPIITARSGFPFNVTTGIDINYVTVDLRLARRFGFGKDSRRSVEMLFDSFNLFNRVNFKEVNGNTDGGLLGLNDVRVEGSASVPASSFRGFISAHDPRIIQLALKLNF